MKVVIKNDKVYEIYQTMKFESNTLARVCYNELKYELIGIFGKSNDLEIELDENKVIIHIPNTGLRSYYKIETQDFDKNHMIELLKEEGFKIK